MTIFAFMPFSAVIITVRRVIGGLFNECGVLGMFWRLHLGNRLRVIVMLVFCCIRIGFSRRHVHDASSLISWSFLNISHSKDSI
jgi:hypothetical protein